MIIAVVVIKGFGVMSEELEDAAREWGQFAIKSWTAAALTGIGFTLIDLNTIMATLTPLYLAAVVLICLLYTSFPWFYCRRNEDNNICSHAVQHGLRVSEAGTYPFLWTENFQQHTAGCGYDRCV